MLASRVDQRNKAQKPFDGGKLYDELELWKDKLLQRRRFTMVADVVLYNGKVVTVDARESVAEAAAVLQVLFLKPHSSRAACSPAALVFLSCP